MLATGCATTSPHPPAVEAARAAEETAERAPEPAAEPPASGDRPERPLSPVESAPADPGSRPIAELAGRPGGAQERVLTVVDDLRFASGSAVLDPSARARLAALAARLAALDGEFRVEIQGHTDATGDAVSNLRTALARAEAVRRELLRRTALPAARLSVVALGAAHPLADNATSDGRARNRRVAVLVLQRNGS